MTKNYPVKIAIRITAILLLCLMAGILIFGWPNKIANLCTFDECPQRDGNSERSQSKAYFPVFCFSNGVDITVGAAHGRDRAHGVLLQFLEVISLSPHPAVHIAR